MVCVASLFAVPEAAYACIYGTDFKIAEVRANGVVELRWLCNSRFCTDGDVPHPLRIVDAATMAEIPGTVVWSTGEGTTVVHVFWRATEPLVAGRTYRVLDLQSYATDKDEFTVLPAVTWVTTAELRLYAELDISEGRSRGEISCRARFKPRPCSPDFEPSPDEVKLTSLIRTILGTSAYATHPVGPVPPLKQRSAFWRDGETPVDLDSKPWSLYSENQSFTEGAARYCYRAAVQNVLDGSERVWEGCLEHGDRPELKARELSREEIEAETVQCTEPPAGYEKAWCEQSTVLCQREYGRPEPSDCENVAKLCARLAESDASAGADDAGAGASDAGSRSSDAGVTPSDAGVTPSDAGVTPSDAGESRKPRRRSAGDSGCSVPRGSSGGSSPLLLLAVALAAVVLRRRKRV